MFSWWRRGRFGRLTDLGHGHYLIGAGPQLGGQRDLVPSPGYGSSQMVVGAPVVRRHRNISAPNRGFLEVTGTLGQGFAVRALIDLHS